MSDYTEHLISQAGGDGDDFPCCTTFPTPLEPGHIRTEDYTAAELFPHSTERDYWNCCQECGAAILYKWLELHVTWHNKLLP